MQFPNIPPKIYAFLIFIGGIGVLVLGYLYFFVFYTSRILITSNVENYEVELYSKKTAFTRKEMCEVNPCVISDVSPLEYTITFKKENYQEFFVNQKIPARQNIELKVELEKRAELILKEETESVESSQEKIQRIRENSQYYVSFALAQENKLFFREVGQEIGAFLQIDGKESFLQKFPKIAAEKINAEYIGETKDIFLRFGKEYYIILQPLSLVKLPYTLNIKYIKTSKQRGQYHIVTEKGSFLYTLSQNISEYQYPFFDFVYASGSIIGIIQKDETDKKENFGFSEKNHLIISYDETTKKRKVLLQTSDPVESIEWRDEQIYVRTGGKNYILANYD